MTRQMPKGGKRSPTGKGQVRLSAVLLALMLRELMDGPCTIADLHEVTGLSVATLRMHTTALYRKRVVHIAAWERDSSGKQSIRAFALGDRQDARKQPPSDRSSSWQARKARERNALLGLRLVDLSRADLARAPEQEAA